MGLARAVRPCPENIDQYYYRSAPAVVIKQLVVAKTRLVVWFEGAPKATDHDAYKALANQHLRLLHRSEDASTSTGFSLGN